MEKKGTVWLQWVPGRLREHRHRWWIALGVIGIALLALSEWLPAKPAPTVVSTTEEFVKQTEERLQTLVESIDGAGACRVLLTLNNGVEYVYATEEKSTSDRQEDADDGGTRLTQSDDNETAAIVVDTGNGREGLLVTEIQPTVRGVVVVCEGGDDETVRERVMQAVTVALDVSPKRVCVVRSE